jgi:hypothetical protein
MLYSRQGGRHDLSRTRAAPGVQFPLGVTATLDSCQLCARMSTCFLSSPWSLGIVHWSFVLRRPSPFFRLPTAVRCQLSSASFCERSSHGCSLSAVGCTLLPA